MAVSDMKCACVARVWCRLNVWSAEHSLSFTATMTRTVMEQISCCAGLYGQRIGCFSLIAADQKEAQAAESQVKVCHISLSVWPSGNSCAVYLLQMLKGLHCPCRCPSVAMPWNFCIHTSICKSSHRTVLQQC